MLLMDWVLTPVYHVAQPECLSIASLPLILLSVYVHRVGRVARAGSSGVSYSLVGSDEFAYMMDLHLFLGRPLQFVTTQSTSGDDALIGGIPQHLIDEEDDIYKVGRGCCYCCGATSCIVSLIHPVNVSFPLSVSQPIRPRWRIWRT